MVRSKKMIAEQAPKGRRHLQTTSLDASAHTHLLIKEDSIVSPPGLLGARAYSKCLYTSDNP